MKATLVISIDGEKFEETELNLIEPTDYENQLPELVAHRLEQRCYVNEKKVRQAIGLSINNNPLKYTHSCSWEAWLQVPSRMNEMVEIQTN